GVHHEGPAVPHGLDPPPPPALGPPWGPPYWPQRHGDTEVNLKELTEKIIGAAIAVHRELGPGLLEATYESALCVELDDVGLRWSRQLVVPVIYKGRTIGEYRLDLMVEERVVVELKSVERFEPVFEAIMLT